MITRQTLIDEVNRLFTETLKLKGYNHNMNLELTSDLGYHMIQTEVHLVCGHKLQVRITFKGGISISFGNETNKDLTASDYKEFWEVTNHIETNYPLGSLVPIFQNVEK